MECRCRDSGAKGRETGEEPARADDLGGEIWPSSTSSRFTPAVESGDKVGPGEGVRVDRRARSAASKASWSWEDVGV